MPSNFCMRCGAKFKGQGRFCPDHAAKAEAQRTRDRLVLEPWRMLYNRPEWAGAQINAQLRDDGRCRARLHGGRRCTETTGIAVHHDPPLAELWRRADGDEEHFVELATRSSVLFCLCRKHHDEVDRARRERRKPVLV